MAGSDEEEGSEDLTQTHAEPLKRLQANPARVSAATRDLIDFLADGPPPSGAPSLPRPPPVEISKSKGSGRLQKMISRLTIGHDRQSRASASAIDSRVGSLSASSSSAAASLPWKRSQPNLPVLNRPSLPRPPQPLSPPSSPPPLSADVPHPPHETRVHSRKPSITRKALPPFEHVEPLPGPPGLDSGVKVLNGHSPEASPPSLKTQHVPPASAGMPASQKPLPSTKFAETPSPAVVPSTPKSLLSLDDAQDLRRLMSRATTAEECRILLDAVLAKAGVPIMWSDIENPYPSPSLSVVDKGVGTTSTQELEHAVLELLLGEEGDADLQSFKSASARSISDTEPMLSAQSNIPSSPDFAPASDCASHVHTPQDNLPMASTNVEVSA
jgi:hypothetical protein